MRVYAVALFLVVGCSQAHGIAPVAGVPGDARMVSLSDEQWTSLCGWLEELRHGEPLHYLCYQDRYLAAGPVPPEIRCGCDIYEWGGDCGPVATAWRAQPPDCATTVTQWAAAWEANAASVCFQWYPRNVDAYPAFACAAADGGMTDAAVGGDR